MPAAPGSGNHPSLNSLLSTCTATGSEITFSCNKGIAGVVCTIQLVNNLTGDPVWSDTVPANLNTKSFTITGTPDGDFTLTADNTEATDTAPVEVICGSSGSVGGLVLVNKQLTQPTLTTATGKAFIVVSTPQGQAAPTQPVTVDIPGLTNGPVTLTAIATGYYYDGQAVPTGIYSAVFLDSGTPALTITVDFTIDPQPVVVTGCQDEYATDYNPAATAAGSCAYLPQWRSAWQDVAVSVPATAGQTAGYISAELRIGFRAGHPLAADRPLGDALTLRATVAPDGYGTFKLGPFLWPQLGAPNGGGYRLDLNSASALGADLFVGYELRRADGELLSHGYALNAAVPDDQLNQQVLSPFASRLPVWPGFDDYLVAYQTAPSAGRWALIENNNAYQFQTVELACPTNPVPVAWLAPGGGFGFWVFGGRPPLGDTIGDGQAFNEAGTGEQRWSQRGEARRTVTASSGVFKGRDLMDGLRTLWASPQVWYQPVVGAAWVPVRLEPGGFPAGRLGVTRQEVGISFTEASAQYAQGQ